MKKSKLSKLRSVSGHLGAVKRWQGHLGKTRLVRIYYFDYDYIRYMLRPNHTISDVLHVLVDFWSHNQN